MKNLKRLSLVIKEVLVVSSYTLFGCNMIATGLRYCCYCCYSTLGEDLCHFKCTDKTFPKSRFTQFCKNAKMEMFSVYIQNVILVAKCF